MKRRTSPFVALSAVAALLVAAVAVGACAAAASPSPTSAPTTDVVAEIQATAAGLDDALAAYEAGDAARAEQLASDAYLDHFELVEGPLEEKDPELTGVLEDLIRDELRAAITAGKPLADVKALVDEARQGLDRAAELLR